MISLLKSRENEMSGDAKDKADAANGNEGNPDEVVTSGETQVAPEVGVDATSTNTQFLQSGSALASQEAKSSGATFEKGVVILTISDPDDALATIEKDAKIKGSIRNYVDLKRAPRGSLLIKPIADKVDKSFEVVYPFMQSHIMLPVSVGETVWTTVAGGRKYWFSRVAGSAISEDVNHTHVDRDLITPTAPVDNAKDKEEKSKGKKRNFFPDFLSGFGKRSGREAVTQEDAKPKEVITNAKYKPSQHESVPRFKPQDGDLVLQGSHNTLISLSTDRGWTKNDEEFTQSNSNIPWEAGRGTIDIVVGRGTLPKDAEEQKPTTAEEKGTVPPRTSPLLVTNSIGAIETDKQSNLNDMPPNVAEGDPDFHTDLSRIYVSMNSPIDAKLTLSEQSPVLAGSTPLEDQEGPSVAIKSNQIRIVAREEGSVRIIKEGDPEADEPNRALIVIQPDGTIHLVGEKIFLGKSADEGGHEDTDPEGPFAEGKMNPYVKFSVLEQYLNDVHDAMTSFCDTMAGHVCPMNAPSPQITTAVQTLKTDLTTAQKNITTIQSTRIFGE